MKTNGGPLPVLKNFKATFTLILLLILLFKSNRVSGISFAS